MFSVSATDINHKVIFIIIMFIFLFIQHQCAPFIIQRGNTMEFILLSCLIFVIKMESLSFLNDTFKTCLISFLIIFPFILFIYFMIKYKRNNPKKRWLSIDLIRDNRDSLHINS